MLKNGKCPIRSFPIFICAFIETTAHCYPTVHSFYVTLT